MLSSGPSVIPMYKLSTMCLTECCVSLEGVCLRVCVVYKCVSKSVKGPRGALAA